jgi:hypothetical protein
MILQIAFVVLLTTVLLAAVVSCAIMGLMQVRRTRALAGEAHKLGMHFSSDDPFDVPRRYADFALISNGHSPRASNFTHGRLAGHRVRAFDFKYEVGHGTRRLTRHYRVIVVETDRLLPDVLMWNESDAESAPVGAMTAQGRVGNWQVRGDMEAGSTLAHACGQLANGSTSIQTCVSALMLFSPAVRREGGYGIELGDAVRVAEAAIEATSDHQDA